MSTFKLKVTKKPGSEPNKEAILKQLETDNISIKELSKKEGIGVSTLYKWKKEQKEIKGKNVSTKKAPTKVAPKEVKPTKKTPKVEKVQTKPKDDKQSRSSYTEEQQEAILKKLKTQNLTFKELAKKEGIGVSTLYTWQKNAREKASKVEVKVAKKKVPEKTTLKKEVVVSKKIVAKPIDQVKDKVKTTLKQEVKVKAKKVKVNVKESAFLTAWETLFTTSISEDCEKMGISSDSISLL
ncbi:MAG: transposase, partial [bacterium]|nr:transposase [bacterium]